jgi:hypothetical protein
VSDESDDCLQSVIEIEVSQITNEGGIWSNASVADASHVVYCLDQQDVLTLPHQGTCLKTCLCTC